MTTGPFSSPRKLLARLQSLSPDEQRLKALELFGLDQVYHRESRPDRAGRLWRVLCANLLAAARYRPRHYDGQVIDLPGCRHSICTTTRSAGASSQARWNPTSWPAIT